jgi:hypothetical protein
MRGSDWLKIPKFSQRRVKQLRWENLGINVVLFWEISVQHISWYELENVAIEQSFVAFYRERR